MFLLCLVKCDFDETWLNDMRARGNGDTERILNVYINCADRLKGHTKHNRDISVRSYGFDRGCPFVKTNLLLNHS